VPLFPIQISWARRASLRKYSVLNVKVCSLKPKPRVTRTAAKGVLPLESFQTIHQSKKLMTNINQEKRAKKAALPR